ncbi:MAG: hypothetical protein M3326_13595 [Actinomycetota bacterium]|nr:hypothetical protein [Actinomycetota bacterium]
MGRAKRLGAGNKRGGLAIEYVRSRKVVRVLGWVGDEPMEPMEIPIDELCGRLGIDPRDVVAPHRYLLFAGSHGHPGGGRRDLAATFDSEEKAWAAFQELRNAHPALEQWGELVAIDGSGQVNQLAWFGLHQVKDRGDETPDREPRRRRLLAGSADEAPTYLRAVTPS